MRWNVGPRTANGIALGLCVGMIGAGRGERESDAEAPEALTRLWRDHDPRQTEQTYHMEPVKREKPYFHVKISRRDCET